MSCWFHTPQGAKRNLPQKNNGHTLYWIGGSISVYAQFFRDVCQFFPGVFFRFFGERLAADTKETQDLWHPSNQGMYIVACILLLEYVQRRLITYNLWFFKILSSCDPHPDTNVLASDIISELYVVCLLFGQSIGHCLSGIYPRKFCLTLYLV